MCVGRKSGLIDSCKITQKLLSPLPSPFRVQVGYIVICALSHRQTDPWDGVPYHPFFPGDEGIFTLAGGGGGGVGGSDAVGGYVWFGSFFLVLFRFELIER